MRQQHVLFGQQQVPFVVGSKPTKLTLKLQLQGGGDDVESQPYGADEFVATQAFGLDEDEEEREAETGLLTRLVGGQPAGAAASLPGAVGVDVLALGREAQPLQRSVQGEGGDLGVQTLILVDELTMPPVVSRHHADICFDENTYLLFTCVGTSFSFINGVPLHARNPKYPRQTRLFNGDIIRLGGNLDGQPGGGYLAFVYCV